MARWHPRPERDRGGDGIQTARALRPRLIPGAAAVSVLALLALYPAAAAGWNAALLGVGLTGVVLLAAGLTAGWPGTVPWSIVFLGSEYVLWLLLEQERLDGRAPFYAGGLVLAAELAYWSLERRLPAPETGEEALRRFAATILVTLGSVAVGAALLVPAGLSLDGGLALEGLGVAAAVTALALAVWAARTVAQEHEARRGHPQE